MEKLEEIYEYGKCLACDCECKKSNALVRITFSLCRHFRLSFSGILMASFVIIGFQPFRDCSHQLFERNYNKGVIIIA